MKKLSPKSKERNIRLSRYSCQKIHKRKSYFNNLNKIFKDYVRITAPPIFCINTTKNRTKVIRFLTELRNSIVLHKKPVCIDFLNTKKFIADGALLLWAELYRCLNIVGKKIPVGCIPPKSSKMKQVIVQVGLAKLMNYKHNSSTDHDDVVHWRAAHGIKVDGNKYEHLLGVYDGRIATALSKKIYISLVEGMKNVLHHAHIHTRQDNLNAINTNQDWWMFSQEKDGELCVLICDLGVGIPTTLPHTFQSVYQRLISNLGIKAGEVDDSRVIEEATKLQVTRTFLTNRGKGLNQMVNAITQTFGGKVTIHSNRGCYTNNQGKIELRDYAESILGTLIYWKVPLVK